MNHFYNGWTHFRIKIIPHFIKKTLLITSCFFMNLFYVKVSLKESCRQVVIIIETWDWPSNCFLLFFLFSNSTFQLQWKENENAAELLSENLITCTSWQWTRSECLKVQWCLCLSELFINVWIWSSDTRKQHSIATLNNRNFFTTATMNRSQDYQAEAVSDISQAAPAQAAVCPWRDWRWKLLSSNSGLASLELQLCLRWA